MYVYIAGKVLKASSTFCGVKIEGDSSFGRWKLRVSAYDLNIYFKRISNG